MTATKKFDPLTAPLSEVLDWLAEKDGWHKCDMGWARRVPLPEWRGATMEEVVDHPITLDRVAGMLPPPWQWNLMMFGGDEWDVVAVKTMPMPAEVSLRAISKALQQRPCERVEAPTELEARARVVAAVLMKPHGG